MTILPRSVVAVAIPNYVHRPLADPAPPEQLVALWRKDAPPLLQARQFVDGVTAHLAAG